MINNTESEETIMTLEIKFSGLTPEQALRLIKAAAGSNAEAEIAESPAAAPAPVPSTIPSAIQQPMQPVTVQPMIPTAQAAPVVPPTAPATPTAPPIAPAMSAAPLTAPAAPPIPTAPPTAVKQYTADELAVAARPLCESPEMREKLLNLLHSFSYTDATGTVRAVQSIRDMPPELYPDLANGIRQLGGRI